MEVTQLEIPGLETFLAPQAQQERAENLRVNQNRVRLLEALYQQAGRDDASRADHHTYTGLMVKFHEALGAAITDLLLAAPGFQPELLIGAEINLKSAVADA